MALTTENKADLKLILRIIVLMIAMVILWVAAVVVNCHAEELTASWYSIQSLRDEGTFKYSKGVMANGRQFSDYGFTAASRDYPLGSKIKVTRADKKASVVVLVTDRTAPRFKGKRIDLSKSAFSALTNGDTDKGLCKVKVKILSRGQSRLARGASLKKACAQLHWPAD